MVGLTAVLTVLKLWKFTLTLSLQKFRESNVFTKEVKEELISRNILLVRVNFLFLHTVCTPISLKSTFRVSDAGT